MRDSAGGGKLGGVRLERARRRDDAVRRRAEDEPVIVLVPADDEVSARNGAHRLVHVARDVDSRDAVGEPALADELAVRQAEPKRLVQPSDALVDLSEEVAVGCNGGYWVSSSLGTRNRTGCLHETDLSVKRLQTR